MNPDYLESVKKQLEEYKQLGEKTFNQLNSDQMFWQYNQESNSIAIIVNHLGGNMLSRWTNFLTSDGEKEWRDRDAEFKNNISTREELISKWNEGWECLFKSINSLSADDLNRIIYIRNQKHTVLEAINRQLTHYPYHIGQIVYIGKMLIGDKWNSLSIPRGKSKQFNLDKFSKPQQ